MNQSKEELALDQAKGLIKSGAVTAKPEDLAKLIELSRQGKIKENLDMVDLLLLDSDQ